MNDSPELTPDQRAVLSLLLRQHKSYAEVAKMLAIHEQSVRGRAYAAIATLGSGEGTSLLRSHREEIGDYLLGQREDLSDSTRSYLLTLANGRAWAEAVRHQLVGIATEPPPELPLGEAQPSAPPPRPQDPPPVGERTLDHSDQHPQDPDQTVGPPVSRRGGALLLAAILIAVIVAVVLIVNGGGSKGPSTPAPPAGPSSTSSATSPASGSTGTSQVHIQNQINLIDPRPSGSAKGIVEVASDQGKLAFLLVAQGLAPTPKEGFFYAVWLITPDGRPKVLGKTPSVGSNGRLQTAELLPANAGSYDRVELTRESNEHATKPGTVILSGPFSLHSTGSKTG
jgi:hypothetical protein